VSFVPNACTISWSSTVEVLRGEYVFAALYCRSRDSLVNNRWLAALNTTQGNPRPSLSLITPTYNSEAYVVEALDSVDTEVLEHLVVDGGSSDRTVALAANRPGVRIIPGPDRGIYDALNKGIAAATGEVVGFLNSDDRYPAGAIADVLDAFAADPSLAVLSGHAMVFNRVGAAEQIVARHCKRARNLLTPDNAMRSVPIINARFFRRTIFRAIGGFNLNYPLAADREFLIRVALSGEKSVFLERVLYEYRAHEGSKTLSGTVTTAAGLAAENLTMVETLLPQWEAQPAIRASALGWYRDYLVTALVAAVRAGSLRNLIATLRRGTMTDPFWFVAMPWIVWRKLATRFQS